MSEGVSHRPAAAVPEGDRRRPETPERPVREVPRQPPGEKGGPKGPEPTRYGDWEKGGRCFDF